jgi:cysteinyl-tRNA synthetase
MSDILERDIAPEDLRYFFLSAHYRSFQDFTWEHLEASKTTRNNIIKKIAQHDLAGYTSDHAGKDLYQQLQATMSDDLDTVQVLTLINK